MSELGKSNISYQEALRYLDAHLEANRSYYDRISIRCVSVLQNEVWRNLVCIIRAEPGEAKPSSTGSKRYGTAHLLEEYADLSQLPQLVKQMPTGTITVDGENVLVGERAEFNRWELYPSANDYSDLPGYLYQSNQSSSVYPGQLQEPLVEYGLPYYPDVTHAVPEWVQLRQFHRWSDARVGYVYLFLPECRARFSQVKAVDRQLRIAVARGNHDVAPHQQIPNRTERSSPDRWRPVIYFSCFLCVGMTP